MDVLSDVLSSVKLQGSVYCRAEFSAPWGIEAQMPEGRANFIVVTRGNCFLEIEGENKSASLAGGDLIVLPRQATYFLRDAPESETIPIQNLFQHNCSVKQNGIKEIKWGGGGGATCELIVGCFEFEGGDARFNPLLSVLPAVLHVRGEAGQIMPWLNQTLGFIAFEVNSDAPGAEAAVSRLTDILFIQAVRAYINGCAQKKPDECQNGWLRAISDRQIGQALSAIHELPGEKWTVAALAARAGMSRAAFAARFANLVGKPPHEYLTEWRMHRANHFLRGEKRTLAEVSSSLGYESEAAFSKAFKRTTGVSPGSARKAKAEF